MKKVYIYHKFERFWHWTQALLILFLMLTGFEIHGFYHLFGFKTAVVLHDNAAIIYVITFIVIITWLFFSGEWKQYMPKFKGIIPQIKYYLIGIFKGEEHPSPKTPVDKFNDLQRLIYFAIIFIFLPLMVISGLLYMNFSTLHAEGISYNLKYVAYFHTFMAFFFVFFVIAHVYLTTTGYKPLSAIKAMLTGWEEMSDHEAEIAIHDYLMYYIDKASNNILTFNNKVDKQTFYSIFEQISKEIGVETKEFISKLDNAHIGYLKLDLNTKIIELNNSAQQILSCLTEQPLNAVLTDLFQGENQQTLNFIVSQAKEGTIVPGAELVINCNGQDTKIALALAPYKENGKITALEGFLFKINK